MSVAAQAVHGLKVCVIPNPDNDFRPFALRHRTLSVLTALLVTVKVIAIGLIGLAPTTAELSTITSARIVELTNTERKKAGAGSLTVSSALTSAAQQKAQDMLDKDYFAHISPTGVTPWFWMAKVGYDYDIAGENLAIDFTEAEDVVAAWLASPSHKENMLLASYTETGVAVATGEFQGGTSIVVVHMFGKPTGVSASKSKQTAGSKASNPAPAAATPLPTPIATPTPLPNDTTAPRVPRIAFVGNTEVVKNSTELTVEGEAGSTVRVLVNNQVSNTVILPDNGTTSVQLSLTSVPEGPVVIRAYAIDAAHNESEISEAVATTKDTVGPLIDQKELAFALLPTFDAPELALFVPGVEATVNGHTEGWTVVGTAQQPLSLKLTDQFGNETALPDLSFVPQFSRDQAYEELLLPSRVQRFSRRLAIVLAIVLSVLLVLAILIRVRIQRPALIAHASAVIGLAFILFLL